MFLLPFIAISANWYISRTFGKFLVIWYIFGILVNCTKKNLATLVPCSMRRGK
jgi:hypothetical protein